VISLDLGEFDDEDDMAKLGVSPVPGSENTVMEGMLTSPVREDPEAILLLRGLERAHVSFQRILLHILERGTIEDMLGAVDFCRTIILVTTHISREEAAPAEIGFARPTKSPEELKREQLESFILPDLLDAFNEILDLPPLTPHEVRQIARYKVGKVLMRMLRRRREIEVADSVYEELITDDLCGTVGAKFLNRTLEERLFNPLARYMLSHARNQTIRIDVNQGQIVITDPRA
jgi:ATP-dependent Clp protease ATP-binding subunit ClpA